MKKRLLNLKKMFSVPLFLMLILAFSYKANAQTLSIDKMAYSPGDIVQITGENWQPGEEVFLQVFNETYPEYNTFDRYNYWSVEADANGDFISSWEVTEDEYGTELILTASGQSSGFKYKIFFTDDYNTSTTLSSNNNPSTYGESVTFTATTLKDNGNTDVKGTLTIKIDGSQVASGSVNNAPLTVTFSTNTLTAGNHTVEAIFTGAPGARNSNTSIIQVVNPKNLTITGAIAENKVYDCSNHATIDFSSATLAVVIPGDDVFIDASTYNATFAQTDAGTNIDVTVTGVKLSGTDADNYTVSPITGLKANINKADANIDIAGWSGTYDCTAHGASIEKALGACGDDLSAGVSLGDKFTNYPGGTAHWTFAGGTNYNDQSGDVAIVINKADANIIVAGWSGTYDCTAHGASIEKALGVCGDDLSAGVSLGDKYTNYPGGTAHWTFAGGTNYNDQSGDVAIVINKADANIVVAGWSGTYDCTAHGASIEKALGVCGDDLSAGVSLGDKFTNYPGGTAHWTFAGGTNYNDQSGDVNIVINKADANIVVAGWEGTYDCTSHGATITTALGVCGDDLSAGVNLGDKFTNAPGGTAHWTFSGGTNYNDQSGDVAIVINKADANIVVAGWEGTYDCTAHGASIEKALGVCGDDLSAGVSLGDKFTNYPGGTAHWTFAGGTNYNDQSGDVAIVINKGDANIVVAGWEGTYDCTAHGASITKALGVCGDDLSAGVNLGDKFTNAPGGTAHWTFAGGTNYNDQSGDVAIVINKADANIVIAGWEGTFDCTAHGASITKALGVCGDDLSAGVNLGDKFTNAPGGTAHWTFTGGTNYLDEDGYVTIKINPIKACVYYSGVLVASTTDPASDKFKIVLSATVIASTNNCGLTNAGIIFSVNNTPLNGSNPAPIGLVNSADATTGTATYEWISTLPTAGYETYTISWTISGGNYLSNDQCGDGKVFVTVSKPMGEFITGGGYLTLTSATNGVKAGDVGSKNNFGFNVKWNKSLKNLQGNLNSIVRRTESDGLVHKWQVKATVMSSLTVNALTKDATFTGKATISDVSDLPIEKLLTGDGNATIQVTMKDVAEPGKNLDLLGITVWNKAGGVWFTSNWDGKKTIMQTIAQGNLQVQPSALKSASTETIQIIAAVAPDITLEPGLKVYPNPFTERLNFEFSSATDAWAKLEIFGITGAKLATLYNGRVTEGVLNTFEYVPAMVSSQMIFYQLTIDGKTQIGKVVFQEKR